MTEWQWLPGTRTRYVCMCVCVCVCVFVLGVTRTNGCSNIRSFMTSRTNSQAETNSEINFALTETMYTRYVYLTFTLVVSPLVDDLKRLCTLSCIVFRISEFWWKSIFILCASVNLSSSCVCHSLCSGVWDHFSKVTGKGNRRK